MHGLNIISRIMIIAVIVQGSTGKQWMARGFETRQRNKYRMNTGVKYAQPMHSTLQDHYVPLYLTCSSAPW